VWCAFVIACSTPKGSVIINKNCLDSISNPLDVKLTKVSLEKLPFTAALLHLSQAVNRQNGPKLIWYARPTSDMEEFLKRKEPTVSLHAEDISLRAVLDQICQQAGWSYSQGNKGFEFTDTCY